MSNPPERSPQVIVPYLAYDDAPAAIAFLCQAFGFEERFRMPMPDGRIGHAELAFRGNVLMLASSYPEIGFSGPAKLPALHAQLQIFVEDVDAHSARARAAGATISTGPRTRTTATAATALDPEGHRWWFSTQRRDEALEEVQPKVAGN